MSLVCGGGVGVSTQKCLWMRVCAEKRGFQYLSILFKCYFGSGREPRGWSRRRTGQETDGDVLCQITVMGWILDSEVAIQDYWRFVSRRMAWFIRCLDYGNSSICKTWESLEMRGCEKQHRGHLKDFFKNSRKI